MDLFNSGPKPTKKTVEYRVLTLWEPWATLVVHRWKRIETRPSLTSWHSNNRVYLIHAAKKWTTEQEKLCTYNEHFRNALNEITDCIKTGHPYWKHHFNFGCIIGSVYVDAQGIITEHPEKVPSEVYDKKNIGYINPNDLSENERAFGYYSEDRFGWILRNPRILKNPIPYKGSQGYYARYTGEVDKLKFL